MRTVSNRRSVLKLGGAILLSVLLLSSCVYEREFAYMNDQVAALNSRINKLEESLGGDVDSRIKSMNTRQAEVGTEMDQLKREMGELSGRVEDNEQVLKRAVERDLGKQDAMQSTLAQLSEKVTELEILVRRQHEYLGLKVLTTKEVAEQARGAVEQKEVVPKERAAIEEPKSDELAMYNTALASFKEGKFEEAMEGFSALLKRYPKSDRADNAQFWIGESHMALGEYERAILAYQEVIKKYPKGNKVPNAMLRQALAFLEIKDKTSTKLLLKKIIKKYPDSSEAQIAKKKLKTLK